MKLDGENTGDWEKKNKSRKSLAAGFPAFISR